METKALKKQMGAAIAMVLVAAIALAASTYAWFVTNNKVEATTSTISAQSNAAFMKIKYKTTATTSDLTADEAILDATPLYPAQWDDDFDADGSNIVTSDGVYAFETAYGTDPTAQGYTKKGDWLYVGAPSTAVTKEYAVANVFNISSKGTDLTNLKVESATLKSGGQDKNALDSALRILVAQVGANDAVENWVLCDGTGVISDSQGRTKANNDNDLGKFGTGVTVTHDADTKIIMYVYYDGNDSAIYSNNLPDLQKAASTITVAFTADAQNK